MEYLITGNTDIGIRKTTNQDALTVKLYETKMGKVVLAVLCDGMGGLKKGEVASGTLIRRFEQWAGSCLADLIDVGVPDQEVRRQWEALIQTAGSDIMNYGEKQGLSMGTTVTAILLTPKRYYIVNVGDTRAYRINYVQAICLTRDHTVVEREIQAGHLSQAEAEKDPRRNVLTQCVGASKVIYPEFFFGEAEKDMVYMLCSDGFRHEITEKEMYRLLNPSALQDEATMNRNARALIHLDKERQERDNISVVLIRTY